LRTPRLPPRPPGSVTRVATLTGLLLLAAACAAKPVTDPASGRRALNALQQRISTLDQALRGARQTYTQADLALRESELAINRLNNRLEALARRISAGQARIATLDEQLKTLLERLYDQREQLRRQLRAAYAMGRQDKLKLLLSQDDPATLNRMLGYYRYLNKARQTRIERIRANRQRLAALQQQQRDELHRLKQDQDEQHAMGGELLLEHERRAKLVAELKRQVNTKTQELQRLHQDRKQLRLLLKKLAEQAANRDLRTRLEQPFAALKGKLPWPVEGRLESTTRGKGTGDMIIAPAGAPVRAIHRGRVAFADWLRGYGLLIIIDHGAGFMSLYGRNQSLYKGLGEWVEAGETIAAVGNSGGNRDPGVYFAIRKHGKAVDPLNWCKKPRGKRVG